MNLIPFLQENIYIDYSAPNIQNCIYRLFSTIDNDMEKAQIAYHFVRDEIPHSFDCNASVVTAKASDVLEYKTGICHAKANLLAALLRGSGIPIGFCFQRLTLLDDDSMGYCVHCYNAIYLQDKWVKVDARGNTNGKNAQFSLFDPILAFPNRLEYNEYFWDGIFAIPHPASMKMLNKAKNLQDIMDNIPDNIDDLVG